MTQDDATATGPRDSVVGYRDRVTHRELERALRRLESDGELTDEERAVIEALAQRLAERVIPVGTEGADTDTDCMDTDCMDTDCTDTTGTDPADADRSDGGPSIRMDDLLPAE